MDEGRLLEHERLQMEQIRELDMEELQVEEVDSNHHGDSDDDDDSTFTSHGYRGAGPVGGFTYNTCLASLHSYLGEVDDTHGRLLFLDGGAILNLPMFYLEGVVLFPEATLPLRVIQPRFIAAVEKALSQSDAPCTIGVVRVHWHPDNERLRFALTGTTAEIRQYRRLDDGSLNVVARGQQRFRLRRRWVDAEGAVSSAIFMPFWPCCSQKTNKRLSFFQQPCGEVQIVQEDTPMRTPKEAFACLASISNFQRPSFAHVTPSSSSPFKQHGHEDAETSSDCMSYGSITSDHSMDMRVSLSPSGSGDSPCIFERSSDPSSVDEEFMHEQDGRHKNSVSKILCKSSQSCKYGIEWSPRKRSDDGEKLESNLATSESKWQFNAPMTFLPYWAYQMYDSYSLARRAADLWRKIIGNPRLDDYARKPDLLSFYIASKLPMSEATRQELLEIDGISYRLRREIQLLNGFNLIRCKGCQVLIAKRSDMVVMSSDGPLNAYVNPHGFVHETITVCCASGLGLRGHPDKDHSWFPGHWNKRPQSGFQLDVLILLRYCAFLAKPKVRMDYCRLCHVWFKHRLAVYCHKKASSSKVVLGNPECCGCRRYAKRRRMKQIKCQKGGV
ncbi:ATP-dependent protease La (LON) domain [Musa troglodytarum]|uniref:ATP-dependent protease La (LON) domain n=1 Tax=Musa troglodytarum TaxID=320322 RepID=A0A9E7GFX4_9LILI|nr:ATP-dependent protease La (LON) domain [Musa troglodytarum]